MKARTRGSAVACSARSQAESPVPGGSATLTASPCAPRAADVAGEAGAGEQRPTGLVQRDRQHPGVVPEDALDAVAVVHVDVDVGDPLGAVVEQPLDAHGDVVVDAEAGGVARHRVVQAAAEVHAVLRAPLPDVGAHLAGALDDARARLVHAGEGRVVLGAEPAVPGRRRRGRADAALHRGDVVGGRAPSPARRRPGPSGEKTSTPSGSNTPSASQSRAVRSRRTGFMGWPGPKS